MLGRIFWLPTWEKKIFTIIYRVPKRKCSSCALRKGLLLRNMNNLRSAYSSLIRHATQQTARHDTLNKNIVSKYKVSVLYLSQYFNHSAIYVKKKHKSFRKLTLLLLHKGFNFYIQNILQQCKRIIHHQNEDTAEDKCNC